MVTGRGIIFICSAVHTERGKQKIKNEALCSAVIKKTSKKNVKIILRIKNLVIGAK